MSRMPDAAAWITQWQRAGPDADRSAHVVRCADGNVAVDRGHSIAAPIADAAGMTRSALVQRLVRQGIAAASACTVSEVAESEHVRRRNLPLRIHDSVGREWPVFTCPIRLAATPARTRTAIGPVGEANAELR